MNYLGRVDDRLGKSFVTVILPVLWVSWHLQIIRVLGLSAGFGISRASDTETREAQYNIIPGLRHGDNHSPWLSLEEGTNPVGYHPTNSNIQVAFFPSHLSHSFFLSLFSLSHPFSLLSFLPSFLFFPYFPSFLPSFPFSFLFPSHFPFHFPFPFQTWRTPTLLP
jgi:hypothetical protein